MKKVILLIIVCFLNVIVYAEDSDYECRPTIYTKCKIINGMEYVMLNDYAEKKFKGTIMQPADTPIIIFPAQLKYPIKLPDGSYLGKPTKKEVL